MTDYFALLNEPRRPWLDPEALKQKFLALSGEVHPDRVHQSSPALQHSAQERYTQINTAYQSLRDPKRRLQHLIELERGGKPENLQAVPPELMSFFMEVSQLCRQADGFLAEKARTASPLLQAQMFERGQEWAGKLMTLQNQMNSRRDQLMVELKAADSKWGAVEPPDAPARASLLSPLEDLARRFSYFDRWAGQIQERIVQLSL